jgi:hypothetical protein
MMGDTNWLTRTLNDAEKRAEELPSWYKANHPTWREIRAREEARKNAPEREAGTPAKAHQTKVG